LRGGVAGLRRLNIAGRSVARMAVATQDVSMNSKCGPTVTTYWHNVVAWEGEGREDVEKLVNGCEVEVEGRLKYTKYTTEEGMERTIAEVEAQTLKIVK